MNELFPAPPMGSSRGYPIDESESVKGKASGKRDTRSVPFGGGIRKDPLKATEYVAIFPLLGKGRIELCRNRKEKMNKPANPSSYMSKKIGMLPITNTNLRIEKAFPDIYKGFIKF